MQIIWGGGAWPIPTALDQTAPNLREMSDLSSYCLQYRLSKYVS